MNGFLDIQKVMLPILEIERVYTHLRNAGKQHLEGVALFAGIRIANVFFIKQAIIPEQTAYSLESGLVYSVNAEELHRINVWLYQNNMMLIAQIHSHPQEAYHSQTDDLFPIVTTIGGLSLVVPHFADKPFSLCDWAVYRLLPGLGWSQLNWLETESLIEIQMNGTP